MTPSHSVRGRATPGKAPAVWQRNSKDGTLAAPVCTARQIAATASSGWSPKNFSVMCMFAGATQLTFTSLARSRLIRLAAQSDQLRDFYRDECACHGHLGCRQEKINASDLLAAGVEEYSSNHASIRQPSHAPDDVDDTPQTPKPTPNSQLTIVAGSGTGLASRTLNVMLSMATLLALSHWMLIVCAENGFGLSGSDRSTGATVRCVALE